MSVVLHCVRAKAVSGAENHLFMLLPALVERGIEVHLANIHGDPDAEMEADYRLKLEKLRQRGVVVHELPIRRRLDPLLPFRLARLIRAVRPDVVHTHMPFADGIGALAAKLARTGAIVSSRHYDYAWSPREKSRLGGYYRLANRLSDSVIAISGRVAKLVVETEKMPRERTWTVLYGCEDQRLNRAEARRETLRELRLPEDALLAGTVGRLIGWKGHRFALEAIAALKDEFPVLRWLVIGDGPERKTLEQVAGSLGLADRVLFLGQRRDVPRLMAAMDLLVHPALAEGFGMIFLEAMTQGTPIVATRAGAAPEIVEESRTGLLAPPGDAAALAEAMRRTLGSKELREALGQAGRSRYEERFTVGRMAEETILVYGRLGMKQPG